MNKYIKKNLNGETTFYDIKVSQLIKEFGSPLYVYDENILRRQCQKIKLFKDIEKFSIAYSVKANSSLALLQIIRSEGIRVDVVSLGEVYLAQAAGYTNEEILFLSNNLSHETIKEVVSQNISFCADALSQLDTYFSFHPKKPAIIRINPSQGAGHHQKVITAGKVKFGIDYADIPSTFQIAEKYKNKICGLHFHIGSLFLEPDIFHKTIIQVLELATGYPSIEYLDFGGGFGIPYRSEDKEFPIEGYVKKLSSVLQKWTTKNKRKVNFSIQPGRYLVAQSGVAIATVCSIKTNSSIRFIGTDLGFNLLLRPEFYGAYHEIINASRNDTPNSLCTIVGNICESGDVLGKNRFLPQATQEGDHLLIKDTGAYGFSMASNYNSILKPAEILFTHEGKVKLIREKENYSQFLKGQLL